MTSLPKPSAAGGSTGGPAAFLPREKQGSAVFDHPTNVDVPLWYRQRPIFCGVCCQLVHDDGKHLRESCAGEIGGPLMLTRPPNALNSACTISPIGAPPPGPAAMNSWARASACNRPDGRVDRLHVLAVAKRVADDRLHDGQEVLGAMLKLTDQKQLPSLCILPSRSHRGRSNAPQSDRRCCRRSASN